MLAGLFMCIWYIFHQSNYLATCISKNFHHHLFMSVVCAFTLKVWIRLEKNELFQIIIKTKFPRAQLDKLYYILYILTCIFACYVFVTQSAALFAYHS